MDNRLQYPFKNDHEIFIALIEDFNNSVADLQRGIIEDHSATMDVKELVKEHYNSVSERITNLERQLTGISPEDVAQLKNDVRELKQWQHDFTLTKHISWVVASTGFLILGYYIPVLISTVMNIFGMRK